MDEVTGESREKFICRDYWSGNHRPYQNVWHNLEDSRFNQYEMWDRLMKEAGVKDGDEFEIIIRKTGRRPFSTIWRLVEPHIYQAVEAEEPTE